MRVACDALDEHRKVIGEAPRRGRLEQIAAVGEASQERPAVVGQRQDEVLVGRPRADGK